jgi:hypothetical protein
MDTTISKPASQLLPGQPSPTLPTAGQKLLSWAFGKPPAARKMTTWRILCGICWAFWTFLFTLAMLVRARQRSLRRLHPGRAERVLRLAHLDAPGQVPEHTHHLLNEHHT